LHAGVFVNEWNFGQRGLWIFAQLAKWYRKHLWDERAHWPSPTHVQPPTIERVNTPPGSAEIGFLKAERLSSRQHH